MYIQFSVAGFQLMGLLFILFHEIFIKGFISIEVILPEEEVEKMDFSDDVKTKGITIFFYLIMIASFFVSAFPFLLAFKYPAVAMAIVVCNMIRVLVNEPEQRKLNLVHMIGSNIPLFIYMYTLIR